MKTSHHNKNLQNLIFHPCSLSLNYIPDEDVRFILCAPNFGAAGLPRPLPATSGLALVVGGGAAIAAQGSSSSSSAVADLTFKGFLLVFGAGAAIEPHKSSSSSFVALPVLFGRTLAAEGGVKVLIKETC